MATAVEPPPPAPPPRPSPARSVRAARPAQQRASAVVDDNADLVFSDAEPEPAPPPPRRRQPTPVAARPAAPRRAHPRPEPGRQPPPATEDDLDTDVLAEAPPPRPRTARQPAAPAPVAEDYDEVEPPPRPRPARRSAASVPVPVEDEDDEDEAPAPRRARAPATAERDQPDDSQFAGEEDVAFEDAGIPDGDAEDMDDGPPPAAVMYGRARRGGARRISLAIGWTLLCLLVVSGLTLLYLLRVDVVRAAPGTARIYETLGIPINVRGLAFEDVRYAWAAEGGRLVLEVRGEIVNVTDAPVKVPPVTFALRNEQDAEVLQWAANIRNDPLAAGERTRFVTRIPSPPRTVRSLQVRFSDRG